jgi:hypothetical protein
MTDRDRSEVADLARSTDELLAALTGLDADGIARRPAPGEWSAWDIAYHVAQIEVWYVAKLCEAATADRVEALRLFVGVWQKARTEGLALANRIPPERLDRTGELGGVPDWTPRQLLERIAAHDREHAAQVLDAASGAEREWMAR